MNPAIWPDSVRALVKFQELTGVIRLIRGRYYRIRKDSDEELTKTPRPPYGKTLAPELFKPCAACGKKTHHPKHKYCSHKCSSIGRSVKRSQCKQCGRETARVGARFCSRACVSKFQTLEKPPCRICGKPVSQTHNRFCSVACSNKAKEGRTFGFCGPLS